MKYKPSLADLLQKYGTRELTFRLPSKLLTKLVKEARSKGLLIKNHILQKMHD